MPCPHCKITIIKRSENESAVSAAAYQSGEKLFSEYDQEQKYYPYKNEVTHKEIMLPPHVPPEYADRNTLWNSAEAQEKSRRDLRRCRSRWNFHFEKIRQMTARCTLRCYPVAGPVAGENPVTIGFSPL